MRKKNNKLDIIVGTVYDEMLINTPDTEEFKAQLDNLERLTTLKNKKEKVSHDTLAIVVGNLLCVLVVVAYENKHVFTSKALGNMLKHNKN
jgi:hypothetical protein